MEERLDPCKVESYQKMGFNEEIAKKIVDIFSDDLPRQSAVYWAELWISQFEYPSYYTLVSPLPDGKIDNLPKDWYDEKIYGNEVK